MNLLERQQRLAELRPRVQAGARKLDKKRPGWHNKIDLSTLRMEFGCVCILGQVEGGYGTGQETLKLDESKCEKLGFVINNAGSDDPDWDILDELWGEQVANRRTGKTSVRVDIDLPSYLRFDLEFGDGITRAEIERYIHTKLWEAIETQSERKIVLS